jgi:hypothetical protein
MRDAVGLVQKDVVAVGGVSGGSQPLDGIWRLSRIVGSGRRVMREEGPAGDLLERQEDLPGTPLVPVGEIGQKDDLPLPGPGK